jgi:hypothetical protein
MPATTLAVSHVECRRVDGDEVLFAGGSIDDIEAAEVIGWRGEIWREAARRLACMARAWHGSTAHLQGFKGPAFARAISSVDFVDRSEGGAVLRGGLC